MNAPQSIDFSRSRTPYTDVDFHQGLLLERLRREGLVEPGPRSPAMSVPEPKETSTGRRMLALASFFVLGLLLVTWQANELALVQMGIKRSKRQIRQEIIKNNELRAKLDEKMAFERIEKIARDKWRLKLLTEGTGKRIIYLELPRSSPRQ